MPDAPIPDDIRGVMNGIAHLIDEAIGEHADRKMGFMLMVFDFGEGGRRRMSYISNAERGDILKALQEFIEKHPDADTG